MQRSPWSVLRKPWFSHRFSVIRQYQNYRKCMEKLKSSKNWSRTSLHSRFSILFLWTRKLLFSKRKLQIYEFRNKKQALNSTTNLLISCHLALIAHDATMSVNSSFWRIKRDGISAVKFEALHIHHRRRHCLSSLISHRVVQIELVNHNQILHFFPCIAFF